MSRVVEQNLVQNGKYNILQLGKKSLFSSVKFDVREERVNNHTSKINVFPVLCTIFFLLEDQKIYFFDYRVINWVSLPRVGEKNSFSDPPRRKKIVCDT